MARLPIRLFLDALLTQTLLILGLQLGINLGTLGGSVTVHLGLERSRRHVSHICFLNTREKNRGVHSYRLCGILLAQLGLRVGDIVVMVRGIGLVALGSEPIGDGALILGVKVLVAPLDTFLVTLALVDDGLGLVTLITGLVNLAVANARLAGAVGCLV